jgi:hypothetical protein
LTIGWKNYDKLCNREKEIVSNTVRVRVLNRMKLEKCLFFTTCLQEKVFLTRIQCNSIDYSQHGFNLFIFRLVIWNIWSGTDRIRVCVYATANTKWTHSLLDDERNKKKGAIVPCSTFPAHRLWSNNNKRSSLKIEIKVDDAIRSNNSIR